MAKEEPYIQHQNFSFSSSLNNLFILGTLMIMGVSIFSVLCCVTFLTFHLDISIGSSKEINTYMPSECEALLKFKHHLVDPSNRLFSWNASNSNCCHWTGVVCSDVTANVLQLHLNTYLPSHDYYYMYYYEDEYSYNKMTAEYEKLMFGGEIDASLAKLKYLNHLDLSGNDFGGKKIPTFFGEMTSLTYLNLSHAGFTGNIPHQIGNLSNLLFLDLSNDYLFATNLHWLSGLSHLQYLDLSDGNFSNSFDWLQTLQALPSLVELRLSRCMFPIRYNQPSSLNFSSLLTLDFSSSHDVVYSVVPKWIFGMRKRVSLQLSYNAIEGPIPDGIQNLTLIKNLDLSANALSSIPNWLYGLHHLMFLNLRGNNLQGNISDTIGNLTSLVKLDLSYNELEGRIPSSLGNLCNLIYINFSNLKLNQQVGEILEILNPCVSHGITRLIIESSHLSGNLTDKIGECTNLVELVFSNNSIHGALPSSFGKLSSLRYLDLSSNQFNGSLPRSFGNISSLRYLDLSENQFNGALPTSFGKLSSLRFLDLSLNQFNGALLGSFGNFSSLRYLSLFDNHFNGNPFDCLQPLSKLIYLSIDENLFQGVVKEDDLANLTSLKVFSASGNNITLNVGPNWHPSFQLSYLGMSSWNLGPKFPSWIQFQKNLLDDLEMSNTGILDTIPPWFGETFSHVQFIDISSNNLRGTMNDFLCRNQAMQIQFLNLASNNLSGEIPDCWRNWTDLLEVNLQRNHFVGNLPPTMGSLLRLVSLHIGHNALSGIFPHCLKNTTSLISLDLEGNKLTGIIPSWVGEKLSGLKILSLRSNKFWGHIPIELCALSYLQVLDLAKNNLSDNIPSCLNLLSSMTQKNKSENSEIHISSAFFDKTISMLLLLKGREDKYQDILGLVTSIDLSENKLLGEIPKEVTNLDGLLFLNLSQNRLTGHIPSSIGKMGSLLAIDFSRNELSGEIPQTISNLSFLTMLDLSYNHLMGKIPTGPQIQTFDASNFVGNNLCGPPLPLNCSSQRKIPNEDHDDKESDENEVKWFFVSMTFGFVVGFWGVVAPLFIFRSWRHTYYRFFDGVWYKIQSWW